MRVLVTGGAGFIGRAVVAKLLAADHEIYVLDDFSNADPAGLDHVRNRIRVEKNDIRSMDARQSIGVWQPEAVLHLAAYISAPASVREEEACLSVNVQGTENLFASIAADVPVVFASSAAVYQGNSGVCVESDVCFTDAVEVRDFGSPYGRSKAEGEFLSYQRQHTSVLRFFNVYGSGQIGIEEYPAVLPAFANAIAQNQPMRIFGDGQQTRDFVHVEDVADVCVAFLEKPASGVWNVGTGVPRSIQSLASMIHEQHGPSTILYEPVRTGDIRHCVADTTALKEHLGWVPPDRLQEYIDNDWAL